MANTKSPVRPPASPEMEAIIHRLQSDPKYRLENEAAIAAYLSGEDPGRSVRFEDDE